MAKNQRINPVGIDKPINNFLDYLYSRVKIEGVLVTDWEAYDRVYKTQKNGGLVPEYFTGGVDYKEVFYDDRFSMTSFFVADDTIETEGGDAIQEVSLIVQANLSDLYPSIAHRADEEIRNLFMFLSQNYYNADLFTFNNVETGIANVYREFVQRDIKLDDMSKKHDFRLNYTVKYTPECCTQC